MQQKPELLSICLSIVLGLPIYYLILQLNLSPTLLAFLFVTLIVFVYILILRFVRRRIH
jgi:hypothetical protein